MDACRMPEQAAQSYGSLSAALLPQGREAFHGFMETGRMLVGGATRLVTNLLSAEVRNDEVRNDEEEHEPGYFSFLVGGADAEDIPYTSFGERKITVIAEGKPLPAVAQLPVTWTSDLTVQKETRAELMISKSALEKAEAANTTVPEKVEGKTSKTSKIPRRIKDQSQGKNTRAEVGFLTAVRKPYYVADKTPSAETIRKYEEHRREFAFRGPKEKAPKSPEKFSAEFYQRQDDLQEARSKHMTEEPVKRSSGKPRKIRKESYERLMGGWKAHRERTAPEPARQNSGKKVKETSSHLLDRQAHKNRDYVSTAEYVKHVFPKTLRKYDRAAKA